MSAPRFRLVQGPAIGERATNNSTPTPNPDSPAVQPAEHGGTPMPVRSNIVNVNVPPPPQQQPPQQQQQHHIHPPPQMIQSVPSPQVPPQMRTIVPSPGPVPQHIGQPQQPQLIQQQHQHQAPLQQQPQQQQPQPSVNPQYNDPAGAVNKCVRFLKTLVNLSNQPNAENPDQDNNELVRNLISGVLYGSMSAEEFTSRLQSALRSQAQPHLLPFLQNTVPALRAAVRSGGIRIEGIEPPPGFVFNGGPPQQHLNQIAPQPPQQAMHPVPPQPPVQQPSQLLSRLTTAPIRPGPMPPQQHLQQPQQQMMAQQPSTSHEPVEEQSGTSRALNESSLKYSFLDTQEIMNRITERMRDSCMVEEEALALIADATEYTLREIIGQLAAIAEHRADSMRVNNNYTPIDDTKRQLRFLEEVDRQEEELRESREKETLIRMSKSKNIGKETIEKAKELQRADAEAKRNRDANSAAIAALANNKTVKNKWDSSGTNPTTTQRARTVRVNTRDLHVIVNNDSRFAGTFLRERLAYGGPSHDATI